MPTDPPPPESAEPPEPQEPAEPAAEAPDWKEGIRAAAGLWADRPPDAVSPPKIDPARWEDSPTFRETFLRWFTNPADNVALRSFGTFLHNLTIEGNRVQPDEPEGTTRHDLRAALADLRAVEGFLAFIGEQLKDLDEDEPEEEEEYRLCELAGELAPKVARIAAAIERGLQ